MKRILLQTFATLAVANNLFGQNPLIKQWDKRFGGIDGDEFHSFQQTKDGGYILGGISWSGISGDKTQPSWDTTTNAGDYWIVKINSIGIQQWDKRFGGTNQERFEELEQTSDGGYILGGTSSSPIGGDKTQANWDNINYTPDYWIVKIDSLGTKQWDKRFGGTFVDVLYSLQQTKDKGYILGGVSLSDSSGDKTQVNWGGDDFWIVKVDSIGNKQWDKRFGGTGDDALVSLKQTSDGGYILGGWSISDSSGDKTQPSKGVYDYWVVKTDSLGIKQWDKTFGGDKTDIPHSIIQTSDGGYVLGGWSVSDNTGDKSQLRWNPYDYNNPDWWVIKFDSLGIKQWDKDLGGTAFDDEYGNVSQTFDGGYLFAGTSYSPISGDKTENNLGNEQTWVVKTDAQGNKLWDKTLFSATVNDDESGFAIQTKDSCYLFANTTNSGIGGYKTEPAWGPNGDYWIVKFCDTTLATGVNFISGSQRRLTVYPNPFSSEVSISLYYEKLKQATFLIHDLIGQTIFSKRENNLCSTYTKTIDLSGLPSGIYFLEVISDQEKMETKIIKK